MENLTFLNQERLRVVHTSLIIRVESIHEKFGIPVNDFIEKFDLWGVSNGKILLIADMMDSSEALEKIVNEVLTPHHFERKKDWETTYERDCYTLPYESGYLFKEIPELEGMKWIDSILLEDGNWIWHK